MSGHSKWANIKNKKAKLMLQRVKSSPRSAEKLQLLQRLAQILTLTLN